MENMVLISGIYAGMHIHYGQGQLKELSRATFLLQSLGQSPEVSFNGKLFVEHVNRLRGDVSGVKGEVGRLSMGVEVMEALNKGSYLVDP